MEKKRIPKRRFREFLEAGEWELSILGRLAVEVNRKAEAGSEAPVMMISSGEGFIEQKDRYSTDNAGSSLKNYTLIKQGELSYNHGYSKLRPFGSCFDLRVPEARIPFVYHTFELPKDDSRFYATYLNNGQFDNELKKRVSSTARMDGLLNISYADYMSLEICHPNIEEQTRIGDFCRRLDTLISLHQQKLSKLKALKQAYLTEMFPAPGEKRPRRRFKGFSGDWEKRLLGNECIEIVAGGDADKSILSEKGKYPVIANAIVGDGTIGYYKEKYRIKAPAVTVTGRGDIGHAQARMVNFTPVVRLLAVRSHHDALYLENAINQHKVIEESTGVPQLTVPQLASYELWFPNSVEEEIKIGAFIEKINKRICTQNTSISKLQSLKQAYLSELFV